MANKKLLILGNPQGSSPSGDTVWGDITGNLTDQTDLQNALNAKADSSDLATVASSGSYNDLTDKPTIPSAQIQSDWNQSDNTQLDYIKNKPTIPAAQVNSDWNASSGVAQILNKPNMTTETLTFIDENDNETNVVVYVQPTV